MDMWKGLDLKRPVIGKYLSKLTEMAKAGEKAWCDCDGSPRKGCDGTCLNTMLLAKPKRIVYVSCDPATLARDLKILAESGYELQKVRAVDQFGHSMHTEVVCLLGKRQDFDKF